MIRDCPVPLMISARLDPVKSVRFIFTHKYFKNINCFFLISSLNAICFHFLLKITRSLRAKTLVFPAPFFRTTYVWLQVSSSFLGKLSRIYCHTAGFILHSGPNTLYTILNKTFSVAFIGNLNNTFIYLFICLFILIFVDENWFARVTQKFSRHSGRNWLFHERIEANSNRKKWWKFCLRYIKLSYIFSKNIRELQALKIIKITKKSTSRSPY